MDGYVGIWMESTIMTKVCCSLAVKHAGFYQNAAV